MTSSRSTACRRATSGEVEQLVALVESAYRGDASRAGWTTEADLIDGQRVDTSMVAAALADPDTVVLVRPDHDGALLACCELRRHANGAHFGMFAVSPTRQGGGLGGEVLAEAERVARDELGVPQVRMSVLEVREELVAWYVRRGYRPTGETAPFPYGDERFGRPRRADLRFVVLAKDLSGSGE